MFSRYTLRTHDAQNGRRFYELALGLALPDGSTDATCLEAWPLHERARSAGAPSHWLGHLDVDDLETAVGEMVAQGAEPLGPTVRAPSGATWATLRDPFGAVIALRARSNPPPDRPVAWHQLHVRDLERAWPMYTRLAAWRDAGTIEVSDPEGGHRLFGWSGRAEGSVANTARWPGVHAHWLIYFPVDDVEATAQRIRDHGGIAQSPRMLAHGRRLAACEDPQGAAFGVIDRA